MKNTAGTPYTPEAFLILAGDQSGRHPSRSAKDTKRRGLDVFLMLSRSGAGAVTQSCGVRMNSGSAIFGNII
ncbi:Uncharacterized protein HZ326_6024 [Fusarium oxysporum f. sp. albedinis]|nr:Uncharacterized protein HZ326_6024 [Fusarium oxysporum f. sp. albedinis]